MYKSKEFDYDLWTTTEHGTKHYWARVREEDSQSTICNFNIS